MSLQPTQVSTLDQLPDFLLELKSIPTSMTSWKQRRQQDLKDQAQVKMKTSGLGTDPGFSEPDLKPAK